MFRVNSDILTTSDSPAASLLSAIPRGQRPVLRGTFSCNQQHAYRLGAYPKCKSRDASAPHPNLESSGACERG